jgi:hypothetical protein
VRREIGRALGIARDAAAQRDQQLVAGLVPEACLSGFGAWQ